MKSVRMATIAMQLLALIMLTFVIQLVLYFRSDISSPSSTTRHFPDEFFQNSSEIYSRDVVSLKKVLIGSSGPNSVITRDRRWRKTQMKATFGNTRVAVLVVYVGPSLPVWFDSFLQSAAISSDLFDWKIFVTKAPLRQTPDNVQLIKLTEDELFTHFAKLVEGPLPFPYETVGVIKHLLTTRSYCMVEFKPCLGHLFSEYTVDYSHWAYADIDQLLGRMSSLISVDILNAYDIYTSTFGDNFRMYMRGQLTIHKNNDKVNFIYRGCHHLSQFKEMLINYLDSGNQSWTFESAEGCYSKVVSDARMQQNVSVYFGATQATDAYGAPAADRESILINNHLIRCYESPLPSIFYQNNGRDGNNWALTSIQGTEYNAPRFDYPFPYNPVGLREYRCSYWVKPEFEVCLDVLPAHADLEAKNGNILYQQVDHYRAFNNTCRESAISHFQGWKQNYLIATTHAAPSDTHALILSDFGFIPYKIPNPSSDVKTFGELLTPRLSHPGRVAVQDIAKIGLKQSLSGGFHGEIGILNKEDEDFSSAYCASFSHDLHKCVCPLLNKYIEIVHVANNYANLASDSITFITAAWAQDFHSGSLDDMLNAWGSAQKIVVLARMERVNTGNMLRLHREDCTVIEVSFAACARHFHTDDSQLPSLPDNILYNIGLDAVATDLVCVCPAGIVLDLPPHIPANAWSIEFRAHFPSGHGALVFPTFLPWASLTDLEREMYTKVKIAETELPIKKRKEVGKKKRDNGEADGDDDDDDDDDDAADDDDDDAVEVEKSKPNSRIKSTNSGQNSKYHRQSHEASHPEEKHDVKEHNRHDKPVLKAVRKDKNEDKQRRKQKDKLKEHAKISSESDKKSDEDKDKEIHVGKRKEASKDRSNNNSVNEKDREKVIANERVNPKRRAKEEVEDKEDPDKEIDKDSSVSLPDIRKLRDKDRQRPADKGNDASPPETQQSQRQPQDKPQDKTQGQSQRQPQDKPQDKPQGQSQDQSQRQAKVQSQRQHSSTNGQPRDTKPPTILGNTSTKVLQKIQPNTQNQVEKVKIVPESQSSSKNQLADQTSIRLLSSNTNATSKMSSKAVPKLASKTVASSSLRGTNKESPPPATTIAKKSMDDPNNITRRRLSSKSSSSSSSEIDKLNHDHNESLENHQQHNYVPLSFPRHNATFGAATCAEVGEDQSEFLAFTFPDRYSAKSRLVAHIGRMHLDRSMSTRKYSLFQLDESTGGILNEHVKFKASELNRKKTSVLPILFNVSAGQHGRRFVRFPEELSGTGCFGSSILRILAGSGHPLVWANVFGFYHPYNKKTGEWIEASADHCGCLFGDEENQESAIEKMNNFYLRAVHVRKFGLQGIYVKAPYGLNFEEEQLKLIAEAESTSNEQKDNNNNNNNNN